MSELAGFQHDMRRGYLGGATGVITSGLVWFAAGLVAYSIGPRNAIWTLFIGAGLIVPVSNLIDRALGAPATARARGRPGRPEKPVAKLLGTPPWPP